MEGELTAEQREVRPTCHAGGCWAGFASAAGGMASSRMCLHVLAVNLA
jgi:hypothetical protein